MPQCMSERSSRKRNERGAAVLLLTFMMAAVLLPLVGLSVDGGFAYLAHSRLIAAVDGAALAISRAPQSSEIEIEQLATRYVEANFPTELVNATPPKVKVDKKTVHASTEIGLHFLGILGRPAISISAESQVR
jgi:Flp pilus assembly protein TadG